MPRTISSSVRYVFSSMAITLCIYAGLESAAARVASADQLSCGQAENPCKLAPLVVTFPAQSARLVDVATPAPEASSETQLVKS